MSFAQPFSNYEILARIGSGAMGTVFKARQKHMDRVVALKVLKPALARDARYVERLRREARIVGQLSHPNIVTGYDLGEEGGYHFFVMEFVEGRSLRQLLAEWGGFPEEQVLDVAIQVAEALDHAWQRGVIHRDIKPGNILITDVGRVKLTDMGLAKGATDLTLTRHGATVGTPQYISPEQARDPSAVDVRSDLYSLGATLFHMATGQPPFRGESIGELISKVLDDRPPSATDLNPAISGGLSLVIRKLLAKNPALRYQTPRELLDDLERVRRAERPKVDVSALAGEQHSAPARRVRPTVWVTGAALVALVIVAAGVLMRAVGDGDATNEGDTAAFRRAVFDTLASAADEGYPAQFARLYELRATTDDRVRLDIIAEEERRLASAIEARVDGLCDRFVAENRAATEQWLADPDHWTDAEGFLREVVEPGIRQLTGYTPGSLPDARLRAAVAGRLDALRVEIAPLCANRDAAYERVFDQFIREDVSRAVRSAVERQDFAEAQRILGLRLEAFHGRDHRPPLARLSPGLRDRLEARRDAIRRELESEIRTAQSLAAARLVRDADARIAAIERLRDELRESDSAPGPMREALERIERELRRYHPPGDVFADPAVDPWPGVEARLRALGDDLAELEREFDRGVLDGYLALGYRVFSDTGASAAARLVGSARIRSAEIEARRLAHLAAFERADRFRSELLTALLSGSSEVRVAGTTVRRVGDELTVSPVAGSAPVSETAVDLEALLAAAPESFRAAMVSDTSLREGRAFWRFARGDAAGGQALLAEESLRFYVEDVWPRLRALGAGQPTDSEAAAALANLQGARARGAHVELLELLTAFERRFGDTEVAGSSRAARAELAEWARLAARRSALHTDLARRVPEGVTVEIDDDDAVRVRCRAGDLASGTYPRGWVAHDGGLVLDVGWLDESEARAKRLELQVPLSVERDVSLRLELGFPRETQEPRIVIVEVHGLALVLCALPSGALAAAVLPEATAYDPDALGRSLAGPILAAPADRQVVPGAWIEVELQVEHLRGKEVAFRATLLGDGERQLCTARIAPTERARSAIRVGAFQAVGVRRVDVRGRADS